jgi:hypothetical protein
MGTMNRIAGLVALCLSIAPRQSDASRRSRDLYSDMRCSVAQDGERYLVEFARAGVSYLVLDGFPFKEGITTQRYDDDVELWKPSVGVEETYGAIAYHSAIQHNLCPRK